MSVCTIVRTIVCVLNRLGYPSTRMYSVYYIVVVVVVVAVSSSSLLSFLFSIFLFLSLFLKLFDFKLEREEINFVQRVVCGLKKVGHPLNHTLVSASVGYLLRSWRV